MLALADSKLLAKTKKKGSGVNPESLFSFNFGGDDRIRTGE